MEVKARRFAPATSALDSADLAVLLRRYGIEMVAEEAVVGPREAVEAAARIGYPVAAELDGRASAHKSDVGGVLLDIPSAEALGDAVGVLAERTAQQPRHDPAGGPGDAPRSAGTRDRGGAACRVGLATVSVGLGGTLVEVVGEAATEVVPADSAATEGMVRELSHGRLITCSRGLRWPQVEAVGRSVAALSAFMADRPDVVEVDLNPVILDGDRTLALDHLVVVED